jgi:alpha-L-arabinofuranosidase
MSTRARKINLVFCVLFFVNCGQEPKKSNMIQNANPTGSYLQIDLKNVKHSVSEMLFGLFLEDINFSVDGGLNANMVNNHSFDGIYLKKGGTVTLIRSFLLKRPLYPVHERLRYWMVHGNDRIISLNDRPLTENSYYARVNVDGTCRLENLGYNGGKENKDKCAMGIFNNAAYDFYAYFRNDDFEGKITIYAADDAGSIITDKKEIHAFSDKWEKHNLVLEGRKTTTGKLVIEIEGKGSIDIDFVNFSNQDYWGKGDPKWSQGHLRKDLVESMKRLHPKFMRFPGGCIVEGSIPGNEYQWKNTVGPLIDRKPDFNLWSAFLKDGGYCQSFQIGFYEYFLLCEDLQMEPLPTVWAGLNCQFRSKACIKKDDPQFGNKVLQNAIDLIEYANGDSKTNPWAALRAASGHEQPFHMKMIGIGNENFGAEYLESFEAVKKEITERYPGMICILSTGPTLDSDNYKSAWNEAQKKYPDARVDEHFYNMPKWVFSNTHRYDNASREGAKVFLGEYAANRSIYFPATPNCLQTALAEAAFLTGVERNSDAVVMTSYSELFSLIGAEQWAHNLINFNPHHVLYTVNYFVQQLYATRIGNEVINIKGETPRGCYQSATADYEHVYIKLVNSTANVQRINITLLNTSMSSVKAEYIHGELKEKNNLTFTGMPEYHIQPGLKEIKIHENKIDINMEKYSFYVLTINRR